MTDSFRPAGPDALGLEIGTNAAVTDDGWLVRSLRALPGVEGPPGILQGGLATGVAIVAARLGDRFGAPVTSLHARLHAPTPIGRDLQLRVRPTDAAARYEIEVRDGEQLLVTAEVELAGYDPTPQVFDLAELGRVPLPQPEPQEWFSTCWVCGSDPAHPHAQHLYPGWHDAWSVVTPWVADEIWSADDIWGADDVIDPLVVAAVLDCPTVWASWRHVRSRCDTGALLGGYHVQFFRDAPLMTALRTVGRCDTVDGRKIRARSALVDEDGVVYASAAAFQVSVAEVPTV